MSITRVTLRREIGLRTAQPWFVRYGKVAGAATGGSTTTLIDTGKILQEDNFWRGSSVYLPTVDTVRVVSASTQSTKTLTWLEPLSAGVQASDAYEVWSQFSPHMVHDAINDTLRSAWPFFFTVEEQKIVLQDDIGVEYSLSALSPAPRWVARVQMEGGGYASDTGTSVAVPGAQDYLKDTDKTFTSEHVGWEVRVYAGTSKGDIRTVSALIDANTLQVSSSFTSTLDATSKYRIVDVNQATQTMTDIAYWSVDEGHSPSILRLGQHPAGWLGYAIRITYEAEYPALSAESGATVAPQEWLTLGAMARLYLMKLASAPASERNTWAALQRTYSEAADQIAKTSRYHHLTSQIIDDQGEYGLPADYPYVEGF